MTITETQIFFNFKLKSLKVGNLKKVGKVASLSLFPQELFYCDGDLLSED